MSLAGTRNGQWRMQRHDAANSGRADIAGAITSTPQVRWRFETGADIRTVRAVVADGTDLVMVLAGTRLQALDHGGTTRWALPNVPVSRIVAAGDLDGTGRGCILVRAGSGTLLLLDAGDGRQRWRWSVEPGTFIHDHAGVLLVPLETGHRMIVCPTYSSRILAFDLVDGGTPRPRWTIAGPWDEGFGPSAIAVDMNGDGRPEIVLSSRLGDADRTRGGRTSSAERVLGRRNGLLYQAIHDLDDGSLCDEVAYAPNSRGWRCARPYGLLAAAPFRAGELPGIVMVSCQVEEYVSVTRRTHDGSMARAWGHFVEKDWPIDERELRVHPDGLGDIDADGNLELVVSLWEEGRWRTYVLDPTAGWEAPRVVLEDRVCWGTLPQPDGSSVLALSVEKARATGAPTDLELREGREMRLIGSLSGATILVAEDAPLPPDVAFMAKRRAGSKLQLPARRSAMIVRRWRDGIITSVAAWGVDAGQTRLLSISRGDVARVDPGPEGALVSGWDGSIGRVAFEDVPAAGGGSSRVTARRVGPSLRALGREPKPLVRAAPAGPELIVDLAGGRIVGGRVAGRRALRKRWSVRGRLPTLVADAEGLDGLLFTNADGHLAHATLGPDPAQARFCIRLDAPLEHAALALPGGGFAVTLRTGVHTLATSIHDRAGELVGRVDQGAYLNPPALLEDEGGTLLVLDDHGILLALDLTGRECWRQDWTAAYSLPITGPFLGRGRPAVLRASGIHGLELRDARGRRRWRREAPLWTYAAGPAAVARLKGGAYVAAQPRRDGVLEVFSIATGEIRWEFDLGPHVESASVTAGDVDGDGVDEFLVGVPDGHLLCVADLDGQPEVRWMVDLGTGVTDAWLADTDGDGIAKIVATTSDGAVQVLDG